MATNSIMKTLYLERSVSNGRNGGWVNELDLTNVNRIVVGMGPGSFAGIRSALAFAQGFALGKSCEVLGLPSPCAFAVDGESIAVVGDARRGMCWIALLKGYALLKDVFQVKVEDLQSAFGGEFKVVSPDDARIGNLLGATFGERYLGLRLPTPEGLKAFAEANPSVLTREPLPIYLNPAVRD